MGKIDIDYQVLHDAFFKNQKKPKLTMHGDLYYEGKEYEIRMRGYKPGRLSPELRQALGIPENSPPPWLINMQRYGPPPAYPNLKIPGVNAPIPETITYGFGRLFTDEKGFTVYADPHGLNKAIY
jgi:splicing factor 3B subunit 2